MSFGVVYCATNRVNGKQYIGLTSRSLKERWLQHISTAKRDSRFYFHKAINKYGVEAFDIQPIVSALKLEWLAELEQLIIRDIKPEYNQTNGGEFTSGRKYSEEVKQKIRIANTGKKRTAEQCKRISEATKQHYETNPEAKAAAIARIVEQSNKPENINKRIKAAADSARNRVWSRESRAKLSASCMGRVYGKEILDKMAAAKRKEILCSDGRVFSCRVEAASITGLSPRTIWRDCTNPPKSVEQKRVTFKYI